MHAKLPSLFILLSLVALSLPAMAAEPQEQATDSPAPQLTTTGSASQTDDAPIDKLGDEKATIETVQRRRRRRSTTPKRRTRRPRRGKKRSTTDKDYDAYGEYLGLFWSIFPHPGDYPVEIGLAGGTRFWETPYNRSNPNIDVHLHGAYRLNSIFHVRALLDYSGYVQDAGGLRFANRNIGLSAGAGVLYYLGMLRLEVLPMLGVMGRIVNLTDGKGTDQTSFSAVPTAAIIGGGGFSILGYVTLSLRGMFRYYPAGGTSFDTRFDTSVLLGLEVLIGSDPGVRKF